MSRSGRLLDDPPDRRHAIVFLTHGALNRSLTDDWVKLALLRRALLRRSSMNEVRRSLPRFAGRLLAARWVDRKADGIWERLLDNPPDRWKRIFERAGLADLAQDDPVPEVLMGAMDRLDFGPVLRALAVLPLRESKHVEARLREVRQALADSLSRLWKTWLAEARFRSPLLIFDEAHHLKNLTRLHVALHRGGGTAGVGGGRTRATRRRVFAHAVPNRNAPVPARTS